MVKVLATRTVNGNQVQLAFEKGDYYIYWGVEQDTSKSKQRLRTPTGRKPSQSSVYKQFVKACKAAEYIKFEKL
jgi:hypothetical protein